MTGVFIIVEKSNRTVILTEGKKRGLSNTLYLAALSTAPLLMYDYTKLEQNVDEVAKEPDVVYAIIFDKNGKVTAHSSRDDFIGQILEDQISRSAAASTSQMIQVTYNQITGEEIWDITYPIYQNGMKWGFVRIGFSTKTLYAEISRNRRALAILSLVAILIAGIAATLVANRISGPIRKLSEGAISISRGNLDQEINIHTGDEIEELSETFNEMTRELSKNRDKQKRLIRQLSRKNVLLRKEITTRERLEEEIIKIERMRALGEMSGGVAHDFNNILGAILGRAQLLLEKIDNPGVRKSIQVIEKAALDGAETVRRIQEFTRVRADSRLFIQLNINEIVKDVIEFTRTRWKNESQARGVNITVQTNFTEIPLMMGDPSGLREVFTNLIINAVDAMPEGGKIMIETNREDDSAVIRVSDTGIGMSSAAQKRIFEPFFTTKGKSGNGLGLAMCYGIISRHKGRIFVDSEEGVGSTFTIRLPVNLPGEKDEPQMNLSSEVVPAKILIIDDDEAMRSVLSDILVQSGCIVEKADSGKEGLERFAFKNYDIVLSDLGMEGMTGWEVASYVKERAPSTTVALITGWGTQLDEKTLRIKGVDFVVSKPFRISEVKQLINQAMAMKKKE
jgi:signal transduction histidine kinase/ActR/RegA family two-component response regulator